MTRQPRVWLLTADIMSQLGGGFRQQRWCEYILAQGETVRVFALEGAFTVRHADIDSVEDLHRLRARWIAESPARAGVRDTRSARLARLIKHTFLVDLFLPSVFRMLLLANAMLGARCDRVAVLCSSPPFAIALVGRILKILHPSKVMLHLDMRDLWSLHTAFPGPKAHKRMIENWVIKGIDGFTTVAPSLADRFVRSFGKLPRVVYNIATQVSGGGNWVGDFSWKSLSAKIRPDSIKIVYTGSIPAGFYDLDWLLRGLERFSSQSRDVDIQFVFVGAAGELEARLGKFDLPSDLIVLVGQLSHQQIGDVQRSADCLLFLGYAAGDNQGQVSIKLFEYFRRSIPILPVQIRKSSDVDVLLHDYCGRSLNILEIDDFVAQLNALNRGDLKGLPVCESSSDMDRRNLAAYESEVSSILQELR